MDSSVRAQLKAKRGNRVANNMNKSQSSQTSKGKADELKEGDGVIPRDGRCTQTLSERELANKPHCSRYAGLCDTAGNRSCSKTPSKLKTSAQGVQISSPPTSYIWR